MDIHFDSHRDGISTAVASLDYLHAPAIIFFFLAWQLFSFINLHKPSKYSVTRRKRWAINLLIGLLLITYIAQAVFYISRVFGKTSWNPPQHSVIHILSSILVWAVLNLALWTTTTPLWPPYIGAWVLGAAIEITLCAVTAKSATRDTAYQSIPLILNSFRVGLYALLLVTCLFVVLETRGEDGTDEERQALFGPAPEEEANGDANGNSNGNKSYDSIQASGSDSEDDVEVKKEQRKRLEEEGGWIGYLKGFAIFLPYLWPDDWKGKACVAIMAWDIIQGRFLNVLIPRQMGIVTNKLTEGGPLPLKEALIWFFMDWFSGYGGFRLVRSVASQYVEVSSERKILDKSFSHLMALSMEFHSNKDSGEVLKSVEQANALNHLVELVVDIAPVLVDLFIALWYVTYILNIYASYTVIVLTVSYIWIGVALTKWQRPARRTFVEKNRTQNKTIYESVSNWQTVAYFNRAPYERARFKEAVDGQIGSYWVYLFRSRGGLALQSLLMDLGWATCTLMAIWEISEGRKPVGLLVTWLFYWSTIVSPLYTIAYSYTQLIETLVDSERVLQLLRTQPTVKEISSPKELKNPKGRVEFEHVGFAYDKRKNVLKDINFVSEPGTTTAFVGETGSGKSTMLKLLFRFYDATEGTVRIDGHDIRDLSLDSLREALGVVPQDPALFNSTIRDNIKYGRLDANDKEIIEACKAAAVHDKIMTFPDGYASKVGERGVKLSGGELQRVAIARVLIKGPAIVMLDEATSAVDSTTEQLIQDAFRRLSTGRTTFVVAHRLSTIMEADTILVVDKGEIVERGTHDELLLRGGKYLELWTKQTVKTSKTNSKMGSEDAKEAKGAIVNDLSQEAYDRELAKTFASLKAEDALKGIGSQYEEGESSERGASKPTILITPPTKKTDEETVEDEEEDESGSKDSKNAK